MIGKREIIERATEFADGSDGNRVHEGIALSPAIAGMRIFGEPLLGFGAAGDPYFDSFRDPAVIGGHYMTPREWLPGAETIISFFLPFTDEVKRSNAGEKLWPSAEWLHGRIEGQSFIDRLCALLAAALAEAGHASVIPSADRRFFSRTAPAEADAGGVALSFTSNWSERHAAFVCGLGTFGLSRGLITKKGVAGRFGSLITDLKLAPDEREYRDVYEYCSMCGACAENCPAGAISPENGKVHAPCSLYLVWTKEKYKPRYGCGKCQTGVPCESCIP